MIEIVKSDDESDHFQECYNYYRSKSITIQDFLFQFLFHTSRFEIGANNAIAPPNWHKKRCLNQVNLYLLIERREHSYALAKASVYFWWCHWLSAVLDMAIADGRI